MIAGDEWIFEQPWWVGLLGYVICTQLRWPGRVG